MDNSAAEQSPASGMPSLCSKGCGFFAGPSSNGMCSKCFKESQHRQEEQTKRSADSGLQNNPGCRLTPRTPCMTSTQDRASGPDVAASASPISTSQSSASSSDSRLEHSATAEEPSAAASSPPLDTSEKKSSKKSRCDFEGCRTRVGLLGFDCRCGLKFCSKHRYSDQHKCTFDYKTDGRSILEKAHPAVVAAKLEKL